MAQTWTIFVSGQPMVRVNDPVTNMTYNSNTGKLEVDE